LFAGNQLIGGEFFKECFTDAIKIFAAEIVQIGITDNFFQNVGR
jgi:hypothetical protein